jgi:hypothetical protein
MREHIAVSDWRRIVLPVIGLAAVCLGALLFSRVRPRRWLGPSRRGAETPEEAARFVAEGAMADEGGPTANTS